MPTYVAVKAPLSHVFFWFTNYSSITGSSILTGDFAAILGSAVFAIYISYSKNVSSEKNCPTSVYLILLAAFTIGMSYVVSVVLGEEIDLFSLDPELGLFGFLGSWHVFKYGFLGLGVMAGYVYHYFTMKAQQHIGTMFINVCYNFTPFLSQVTAYMIGAQVEFPGAFTAFGGAVLFVGCTLLAMSYRDQQEMAHVPLIGTKEVDLAPAAPAPEERIRVVPEMGSPKRYGKVGQH